MQMTTIEQIVPPFELCRKIPADAFNDTALAWKIYPPDGPYVAERDSYDYEFRENAEQPIIPAPTAQEILEEMPDYHLWKDVGHAFRFFTRGGNGTAGIVSKPSRFPEMLLSVWLTVRRMEEQEKADAKEENQWRCTDR